MTLIIADATCAPFYQSYANMIMFSIHKRFQSTRVLFCDIIYAKWKKTTLFKLIKSKSLDTLQQTCPVIDLIVFVFQMMSSLTALRPKWAAVWPSTASSTSPTPQTPTTCCRTAGTAHGTFVFSFSISKICCSVHNVCAFGPLLSVWRRVNHPSLSPSGCSTQRG